MVEVGWTLQSPLSFRRGPPGHPGTERLACSRDIRDLENVRAITTAGFISIQSTF